MLQYPDRADSIGRPELASTLAALYTGQPLSDDEWHTLLQSWEVSYRAAGLGDQPPARLHPARCNYYRKAAAFLWESNQKPAAMWPILHTWTEAVASLATNAECQEWHSTIQRIGLGQDDFAGRLEALDGYLDLVEETLDAWAEDHGV
jgi:hypothetical protein